MLNNKLANSFNIYTKTPSNPEIVNDDEIAVAVFVNKTKYILYYGYNLGLANKYLVETSLLRIGDFSQIKKDANARGELVSLFESYISSELNQNGFYNFNLDITQENQTFIINITLNKGAEYGTNYYL